ncbi:MAG: hypothetical protein LBR78_01465 [Holosporales bacterium]|jgi:diaminopimelate epimerase|nr:hypothetical protein [Holosporales bacterium]
MGIGGMEFTKAHVNGNDFVIVFQRPEGLDGELARAIADRRYGVGCDQILFVQPMGRVYDVAIFNSDGTLAKMCGNGVCAVASCVAAHCGHEDVDVTVRVCDTEYSIRVCRPGVTVGFPLPEPLGSGVVSTGNKHVVVAMDEIGEVDSISTHHSECNLHFVSVMGDTKIRMKTFERGAGWTNACGSGAVASVFSLGLKGRLEVQHDGGTSFVEIASDRVYLTVRPRIVFKGVLCEQGIV